MENEHILRKIVDPKAKVTLVALHGLASSNTSMFKNVETITGVKEIICPDIPGHNGLKARKDFVASIDGAVDYIKTNITDKLEGKYVIVGFSLGGILTQRYIERFGDDNHFLGGIVWASPIQGLTKNASVTGRLQGLAFPFLFNPKYKGLLMKVFKVLGYKFSEKDAEGILMSEKKTVQAILKDIRSKKANPSLNKVPTLFIYDNTDPWVSPKDIDIARSSENPMVEVMIYNGSGHFHSVEERKDAITKVQRFIDDRTNEI